MAPWFFSSRLPSQIIFLINLLNLQTQIQTDFQFSPQPAISFFNKPILSDIYSSATFHHDLITSLHSFHLLLISIHPHQWTDQDVDGRHIAQIRAVSLLFGKISFSKLSNFFSSLTYKRRHHWGPLSTTLCPHFKPSVLLLVNYRLLTQQLTQRKMEAFRNPFLTLGSSSNSGGEILYDANGPVALPDAAGLFQDLAELHQRSPLGRQASPPPPASWDHTYEDMTSKDVGDPRFLDIQPYFLNGPERECLHRTFNESAALAASIPGTHDSLNTDSPYDVVNSAFLPTPLPPPWVQFDWTTAGLDTEADDIINNVFRCIPMEYQPGHDVRSFTSPDAVLETLCHEFPPIRDLTRHYSYYFHNHQDTMATIVWRLYTGLFDRFNIWQCTKRQQSWRTFNPAQQLLILPPITDLLNSHIFQRSGKDPVHKVLAAALSTGWRVTQNTNVSLHAIDINSLWRDYQANAYCRAIFTQIGIYDIDLSQPAFAPWLLRLFLEIRSQQFEKAQAASTHNQQNIGSLKKLYTESELITLTLSLLPPTYFVPAFVHGYEVLDALYTLQENIRDLFLSAGVDSTTARLHAMQSFGDRLARRINSQHKQHMRTHSTESPTAIVAITHSILEGKLEDLDFQLRDAIHEAMRRGNISVPTAAIDAKSFFQNLMSQSAICHHILLASQLGPTLDAGIGHPGYNSIKYWTQDLIHSFPSYKQQRAQAEEVFQLPHCPRLVLELVYFISTSPAPAQATSSSVLSPPSVPSSSTFFHDAQGTQTAPHSSSSSSSGASSSSSSASSTQRQQWTIGHSSSSSSSQASLTQQQQPHTSKRGSKAPGHNASRSSTDLSAPHDSTRDLTKLAAAITDEAHTQQLTQVHVPPLPSDIHVIADSANHGDDIAMPAVRIEVYISTLLQTIAASARAQGSESVACQHASARVTFDNTATHVNGFNPLRRTNVAPFAWIRWAADLMDDGQTEGAPSSLQLLFANAGHGWDAGIITNATRICQDALQRLRERTILVNGLPIAYTALNEGGLLERHLLAFLTCLSTNNQNDPWLGQSIGSPLGYYTFLYDLGSQLDMLRIFLTAFTNKPTLLAYKAMYGERSVLLPLSMNTRAGDDILYRHRATLSSPNHPLISELQQVHGNLLVFESLDSVYLHHHSRLRASEFHTLITKAINYVNQECRFRPPPLQVSSPHVVALAALVPAQYHDDQHVSGEAFTAYLQTLDYVHQASTAAQQDSLTWVTQLGPNGQQDLRSSLWYIFTQNAFATRFGPVEQWVAGHVPSLPYGSLQGVGSHVDQQLDPAMYFGTAVASDQISINSVTGVPNIYARMIRHASTATHSMLPQSGSTLLAANTLRHFLRTGTERLTGSNMGLPPSSPTLPFKRVLIDTANLLLQLEALPTPLHTSILQSLRDSHQPLPHMGSNYQQQVQHLFAFYLALLSPSRIGTHKGLNAVVMLTLNTPGCTAPIILAVTHFHDSGVGNKMEIFPLQHEATSRPHAKLLDISATFNSDGAFAIRITYDNISMATPAISGAHPIFPNSAVSSPVPASPLPPIAPSVEVTEPEDAMAVVPPAAPPSDGHTVFIIPHQRPKTVSTVVISGLRHSLDPALPDTSPFSIMYQLCNGLMATGYYSYLPQIDGSPVDGIRAALVEAKRTHPRVRDTQNNFHSYEVALPLTCPIAVGGTTTIPSLFTWCHNSKVLWERTPYTLQGLTAEEANLYNKKWEMLVTREGIPGESNCDAYGRDTFADLVQGLLPQGEPFLVLVQWIGSLHSRQKNKTKTTVRTSGPIQVAYFHPRCLPCVTENVKQAIQSRRRDTGPQWISLQKTSYGSYNVTDNILSHRNPALIAFREFTFDLYTSSAIPNFQAATYGQACHVTPRVYYSTIQIPPHLTAEELLTHYSQPGSLPPEFIALRNWPQHPDFGDGSSVMLPGLLNRTGPCILAVLNAQPALSRLPYKDDSLFQKGHSLHPAREEDRYHTTIGSLLYTVESTQDSTVLPDDMLIKYGLSAHIKSPGPTAPPTRTPSSTQPGRSYRQAASSTDDSSRSSSLATRESRRADYTPSTVSSQSTSMATESQHMVHEMVQRQDAIVQRQNERIDRLADLVTMLIEREIGPLGATTQSSQPSAPK